MKQYVSMDDIDRLDDSYTFTGAMVSRFPFAFSDLDSNYDVENRLREAGVITSVVESDSESCAMYLYFPTKAGASQFIDQLNVYLDSMEHGETRKLSRLECDLLDSLREGHLPPTGLSLRLEEESDYVDIQVTHTGGRTAFLSIPAPGRPSQDVLSVAVDFNEGFVRALMWGYEEQDDDPEETYLPAEIANDVIKKK